MMRGRILVRAVAALVVAVLALPVSALADGRRGGFSGRGSHSGAFNGGSGAHSGFGQGFNGHRHFHSSPIVVVGPSPFWYSSPWYTTPAYSAPPVVYTPPPVYVAPQVVYQAPPPAAYYSAPPPPPAPPGPRVVEFATGRYELRGDGMNTPYSWVWIPNPPAAPPAAPAAPVAPTPPAAPTAPPARPSVPPASDGGFERPAPIRPARAATIYKWTDDDGVLNITDDPNKVPDRYRVQQGNRTNL